MDLSKSIPCRNCQQNILFIPLPSGKYLPVDAKMFVAQADCVDMTIYRTDGTKQKGVKRGDVGFVSHFDSCGVS
ncbi:MAG: hypothetical protein IMZ53_12800 [Thermoplasmata archaeon]|nr:hypothetical protein [Thermoplasmata archaeon]